MPHQVHAHHEVDRIAIALHELARAHRAGHEVRRLFAIERRDDHAASTPIVCQAPRDLDEHGDRSRVVIRAPEHVAPIRPQVIEVRADEHIPLDVAANPSEHVRTAAPIHALFVWIEPGIAQCRNDERPRQVAALGPRSPACTFPAAQLLDERSHRLTV